jgi:hypothetical protein
VSEDRSCARSAKCKKTNNNDNNQREGKDGVSQTKFIPSHLQGLATYVHLGKETELKKQGERKRRGWESDRNVVMEKAK